MKKIILIALLLPTTAFGFCWGVYGTDKEHCDSGHFNYERDCSKLDNSRRYWVKNWGHEWELGACPTQTVTQYKQERDEQKEAMITLIGLLEELVQLLLLQIELQQGGGA